LGGPFETVPTGGTLETVPTGGALETVRTVSGLRGRVAGWRAEALSVGLVPTMGALHAGHIALVQASLAAMDRTVVSLFVNPKQFGPSEDLDSYPRDEAADRAMLDAVGAHLLYAPEPAEVYGSGFATQVTVSGLGDILEGEFRPGFFNGVATVVAKLLGQCRPDTAFFGDKDYQQLLVVRRMAGDLDLGVEIKGVPTVREADGLALSSRNAYLTAAERAAAPVLFEVISGVAARIIAGADADAEASAAMDKLIEAGFGPVDYVCVRDAETLGDYRGPGTQGRVLAAARLGRARLIDNVAVAAAAADSAPAAAKG